MSYQIPANEKHRLAALRRYRLLDSDYEPIYNDFTEMAAYICDVPIAMINLIDESRQWVKAKTGLDVVEVPRGDSFCTHTILDDELTVVEDMREDERFASSPFVAGDGDMRFYVGAPLIDSAGYALGSLCVIDREPRKLSSRQLSALQALARQVITQFELRRTSADLAEALEEIKTLHRLLPMCCYCKNIRDDKGYWESVEQYISTQTDARLSHGICPKCLREHYPDLADELSGGQDGAES